LTGALDLFLISHLCKVNLYMNLITISVNFAWLTN
jgi:hypothetical protein